MATSKIESNAPVKKSFTYNSINIDVYAYESGIRIVQIYTNSSITQSGVNWTNVGSYTDGLQTCTIISDANQAIAVRQSNSNLQIKIPQNISGNWFVGMGASIA